MRHKPYGFVSKRDGLHDRFRASRWLGPGIRCRYWSTHQLHISLFRTILQSEIARTPRETSQIPDLQPAGKGFVPSRVNRIIRLRTEVANRRVRETVRRSACPNGRPSSYASLPKRSNGRTLARWNDRAS